MRVLKTIPWLILIAVVTAFLMMNLTKADVNFWPFENGQFLHFSWPIGFIAVFFFLLGWLPTWLVHLARKWQLKRRIATLEAIARQPSAALTTTQLDAAAHSAETPAADRLPELP